MLRVCRTALVCMAPALLLPASCSDDTAPTTPDLLLVLGAGAQCAADVQAVELQVKTGTRKDMSEQRTIRNASDLPVGIAVRLPPEPGAVHLAEVTFSINPDAHPLQPESRLSFSFPDGASGRIVLSLACACLGTKCPVGHSCEELPVGSGKAKCVNPASCGNHACETTEACTNCPSDCPCACGNGVCEPTESCSDCPLDCSGCCGNGKCDPTESCSTCVADCGPCCGNGKCDATESCSTCQADCGACCGDGKCVAPETCSSCPKDCGACCGNKTCEAGETCATCPVDCGACQICPAGESCSTDPCNPKVIDCQSGTPVCTPGALPIDVECDDNNPCTPTSTCDGMGNCQGTRAEPATTTFCVDTEGGTGCNLCVAAIYYCSESGLPQSMTPPDGYAGGGGGQNCEYNECGSYGSCQANFCKTCDGDCTGKC